MSRTNIFLGHLLSFLSLTVFSIIPYISPWFMMLFNVFSLFGSITAFLSCCFSYVSDVSLEENRATRYVETFPYFITILNCLQARTFRSFNKFGNVIRINVMFLHLLRYKLRNGVFDMCLMHPCWTVVYGILYS